MTVSSSTRTASVQRNGPALWIARILLVVAGLVGLAGATYFTFFASPADGGVVTTFDWFVAAWKYVVCAGFLVVALAPGLTRARRIELGLWFVLADVIFGLVKLFGYGETEALGFFVGNAVLAGLLLLARHPRSAAERQVMASPRDGSAATG